ncbi:hypothetical protein [Halalkalicoccus sp. NIPERK01]|uniref:hypothetical protein n=1 Tax=Halalkalicoccus sp. NIPERK01 TaxID=3053469 RepID=UPI00256F5F55|nr:hypothetical protein [Halalkalicoccus sp. NIPERK01]MDL5362668.1 hypothetical protein [Halalkalicoccus sp. NIPERK01]
MAIKYYDLVLLGVLGSLVLGGALGAFTAVGTVPAVVVTAGFAIALIAHALFVRGPVDRVGDLTDEVEQVGPVDLSN